MRVLFNLAAVLFLMGLVACQNQDLQAHMAALDRAYIPAYVLSLDEDTSGGAVMAANQLKHQWSVFRSQVRALGITESEVGALDKLVSETDSLLSSNNRREAARKLTVMGRRLRDLRARRGVEYLPR